MPSSSSILAPAARSLTRQALAKRAVGTVSRKVALSSPLQPSSSLSTLATRRSSVTIAPSSLHRTFQTTASSSKPESVWSDLTDSEYQRQSADFLMQLEEDLDRLHESSTYQDKEHDWEYEMSDGVLNLHYRPHGTWVLNKQPAIKQLWLSSPFSGPKKFELCKNERWRCVREGQTFYLDTLLDEELSKAFGFRVGLDRSSMRGDASS